MIFPVRKAARRRKYSASGVQKLFPALMLQCSTAGALNLGKLRYMSLYAARAFVNSTRASIRVGLPAPVVHGGQRERERGSLSLRLSFLFCGQHARARPTEDWQNARALTRECAELAFFLALSQTLSPLVCLEFFFSAAGYG